MEDYVLSGSVAQYVEQGKSDPLQRFQPLKEWFDARHAEGLDPYSKYTASAIAPLMRSYDRKGQIVEGANFGSQDYLNLAAHPQIRAAAKAAIDSYGVHSAGSAALMGNTEEANALERRIAEFTGYADATLFPTGWAAGYGTIRTLVREQDHVVIDLLAHNCLMEGAKAATRNVSVFPHLSTQGVRRRLERIRATDPDNAILVVTESCFSMDSDTPDIPALQRLCHSYGATLMVDCAHDLGAVGPTGRGHLELMDMVGKVDVLMGSFSKTFGSIGGFVASNAPELKLGIRYTSGPACFSNAMSPVNAAVVKTCFDIVDSLEGADRRRRLARNVRLMRGLLAERGFRVMGEPSAIVPVLLGDNPVSRLVTRNVARAGAIVNLVEYPAVSRNTCRWRLQMMADHTEAQIRAFADIAARARAEAEAELLDNAVRYHTAHLKAG